MRVWRNSRPRAYSDRLLKDARMAKKISRSKRSPASAPNAVTPLLLFRIELLTVQPPIWRRFHIPGDITFEQLHEAIQRIMGWDESHLYEFSAKDIRIGPNIEGDLFEDSPLDAENCLLSDFFPRKGQTWRYLYDFGDAWEHRLKLENILDALPPGSAHPVICLDGARACPPEDIGGAAGYANFCKVLKKPGSPEYRDKMKWFCGTPEPEVECGEPPFDPELFDIEEINALLAKQFHAPSSRGKKTSSSTSSHSGQLHFVSVGDGDVVSPDT